MPTLANAAKEITALAATYRDRAQDVAKEDAYIQQYVGTAENGKYAEAIQKWQNEYRTYLVTGKNHPNFPLPPRTDDAPDLLRASLEAWQANAARLHSTVKAIAKADGNTGAGKMVLEQLQANPNASPQDVLATLKQHTPLFALTHAPTKEEAITAIVTVEKANRDTQQVVRDLYANVDSSTAILMDYATGGKRRAVPTIDGTQLSAAEAKKFGAALLQVEKARENLPGTQIDRPEGVFAGADGKNYRLEPKEISAYLQRAKRNGTHLEPVDVWAKREGVALNNHGKEYRNGVVGGLLNFGETIYIETPEGLSRTVGDGVVTEPLKGGSYGFVMGLPVADKDNLDLYVSSKILKDIEAGKKYEGTVRVMQQMKPDKDDKNKQVVDELKIGFTNSLAEFRTIQASTWDKPGAFAKRNEGAYVELSYDQWKVLKQDIGKKPDLNLEQFVSAHPEMKLAVIQKKDLPYLRQVDGAAPQELAAQKQAFNALQKNVYDATDGIGNDDLVKAARAAQPPLVEAANHAYIAGAPGATPASAAKAVNEFMSDVAGKTTAYVKHRDALRDAARAGKTDAELAPLRDAVIKARVAALGENTTVADTTKALEPWIAEYRKIGQSERSNATMVVPERTIKVGAEGLSQAILNKAPDVVKTIKAEMEKAGMKHVTTQDAVFVVSMMVASENKLANANKATGEWTFAFTRDETDKAIGLVKSLTDNGVKHAAGLYKVGELNPTAIVGQLQRETSVTR